MSKLPTKFPAYRAIRILLGILLVVGLVEPFVLPPQANAAAATGYLELDRVAANTATGGSVCFNPTTNETTVRQMQITFAGNGAAGASSFTVATAGSWNWNATGIPAGTTAFPGTMGTNTVSTNTVTFVVTADQSLNTGTMYCLHFSSTALTTPTSAGNNLAGTITLRNSGGTLLTNETVNYATSIISNDQITVTGTVPSTFTMSLSANSAAFSTNIPTSGSPATTPAITLTVSTNANNGWIAWAKNANAHSALTSTGTSDSICFGGGFPTSCTTNWASGAGNVKSLSGAEGYGLSVAAGTGTPSVATEYAGSATSFGMLDSTGFEKIVSHTIPANGDTATLTFGAEAASTNKAATDYTDTVTVTASGQF